MRGTGTPAGERERQTHLRQWGQHGAAGWLYLVPGRAGAGAPRSLGHAASPRMWPPLTRRRAGLRQRRQRPGVGLSGDSSDTQPSPWPRAHPVAGHRTGAAPFPACRRRGDRARPAESAAPSATQEPRGRRSRGGAGAEGAQRAGCMVPVLPSSMPPDTLTLSEARPRRRRGGAERPPADRGAASPAGAGQGPHHGGRQSLSSSLHSASRSQ